MAIESLTGPNKAAILLMCLGEQATAKIFQEFSDEEIHQVAVVMSTIDHIPEDMKQSVLDEFEMARNQFAGVFIKGNDFAKKAIAATGDGSNDLLDHFISGTESRPLETIELMHPRMVGGLLEKEHPQTVALVLSTQQAEHASDIISYLPEEIRADVVYRIAKLDQVSSDVILRIEDALDHEIGLVAGKEQEQIGGIDKVVEMLDRMQDNLDADILDTMEETDPDLVEEIRKRMFTFENLIALDGRSLQMILREVNNDSLTLSLKTASEEMKEKIFANMSIRAADMVRDDLEAMGPVRLSEVETIQQSIVKIAMKLEEEGKLVLGSGGGDELV